MSGRHAVSLGLCLATMSAMAETPAAATRPPFFAMAYGLRERDPVERVRWMAAQGFEGIAPHVWNDELFRDLEATLATTAVQSGQFRVFGVYFPYDLANPSHRRLVSAVIRAGAPVDAPVWITFKPVNTPAADIVALLGELCDEAAAVGTEVVLYPHDMTWCLDAADTLVLIERVRRANLFTSLHLHQELRAGNADRLPDVIAAALPHTRLVSISGALDPTAVTPGSRDWSDVVRPVQDSVFPVADFVRQLRAAGYTGPIGLQNWRLPGDAAAQHEAALAWWRALDWE